MFLVGATHGFAGTASVMIVIPIAISQSVLSSALYLLLFGIGTMGAMALFGYLVGSVASKAGGANHLNVMQSIAGGASVVVGMVWISETLSLLK
jgi:sulfite exporter TauE/SafE